MHRRPIGFPAAFLVGTADGEPKDGSWDGTWDVALELGSLGGSGAGWRGAELHFGALN